MKQRKLLTLTEILRDVENQSAETRIQAVFQILVEGSLDAEMVLCNSLASDPSPIVRHECAYCLGELGGDQAVSSLIKAIQNDQNPFVIHEACLALANTGDKIGYSVIKKMLDHPNRDVSNTAMISLQRLNNHIDNILSPSIENALTTILDYNKPEESRIQSSFVLLDDGSDQSVDLLLQALDSEPNAIVKHEIIFSLGEIASRRAVTGLINTLKRDKNAFVVHEALLALGTLGDLKSREHIQYFIDHPNPDISESAEIALERLLSD